MDKATVRKLTIPDAPGVYFFRDGRRHILYVGKATSLRSRIRSYFNTDIAQTRGALISKMLEEAAMVTWEETDSVLEALLLEAQYIKKHQPSYNTRDKDNKSFNYVVITREAFPRVSAVRGRELFTKWNEKDIKKVFGPFTSGGALKTALKIIRKILPFRDTCVPESGTPCFNAQIGLCPGVCSGAIDAREYAQRVRHIALLFEGKKRRVISQLKEKMQTLAKSEKFEEASTIKQQVFALEHIRDTALLGEAMRVSSGDGFDRIEAYDVAHIQETARVGVMVVVADGKAQKGAYRKFNIQTNKQGDIAALEEILRRRFAHTEWPLPKLLVIDGGVAQKNAAARILDEYGYRIPVVHVVKNDRHKAGKIVGNPALIKRAERDIILANAEAHRFAVSFHRQKRGRLISS